MTTKLPTQLLSNGSPNQILGYDGSGNITEIDPSTLGGGGGATTLLGSFAFPGGNTSSVTIGSGLDIDVTIDSTYSAYIIDFDNVRPASNARPRIQFSQNGGSSYIATDYDNAGKVFLGNTGEGFVQADTTAIALVGSSVQRSIGSAGLHGQIRITNPAGAIRTQALWQLGFDANDGGFNPAVSVGQGALEGSTQLTPVDAFAIGYENGTFIQFTGGTIRVYGLQA